MGCENTLYECTEHISIRTARGWRYLSLFIMFLVSLIGGILLVISFPTNINCPPSFNAQGLGILLLILSCCTCTQTMCYWYDADNVVYRTSTQEVGDLPFTVGPAKATTKREVFGGIDIGHKVCAGLSSCWQICGFLSCFGIGISLMTGINGDGTVIGQVNYHNSSNNSSTTPIPCEGESMYILGLFALIASILFFTTMCWRICRDPQTLLIYQKLNVDSNNSAGRDVQPRIAHLPIDSVAPVEPNNVELTLQ